jgi:RNA polymerase sigma-70 factor (ECF subfamily)
MEDQDTWQALIQACKDGKLSAQEELYRRYVRAMLNTSYRILNNREDAEDAVQEAFVKAFRNIHSYRGDASFGSWLKRIVVNQSLNILKKRKQDAVAWDEKTQLEWEKSNDSVEGEMPYTADEAYEALHQLSDGYRTIFSLYLLEGYDHKEIAEILGISVSTSISQYNRAKKRLQKLMKIKKGHGQDRAIIS